MLPLVLRYTIRWAKPHTTWLILWQGKVNVAALVGTATVFQICLCINSKMALRCSRLYGALDTHGREFQSGYVRCCFMGHLVTRPSCWRLPDPCVSWNQRLPERFHATHWTGSRWQLLVHPPSSQRESIMIFSLVRCNLTYAIFTAY